MPHKNTDENKITVIVKVPQDVTSLDELLEDPDGDGVRTCCQNVHRVEGSTFETRFVIRFESFFDTL